MTNPVKAGLSPVPQVKGIAPELQAWHQSIFKWLAPTGQNDVTANRPTANLFVGQQFFDNTLGYMVWVKSIGPPAVWVNGAGAVV